jgi:hypothetical protein
MAIPVLRPVDMGAQQINNAADPALPQDVATKNYVDGSKTSVQTGVQNTAYDYAADTGAANAYAVTLSPVPTLTTGLHVAFKAANANSAASTLNVNSLGAKTIKKKDGATDLASGDISSGQLVLVMYDGTNFQMVSAPGTSGGGGGTAAYVVAGPPDAPPQTPNAMDDEFAATSLNGKWTRTQSGAITDSYSLGRLMITGVSSGTFLITQSKPASPCEFTACFTIDTNNTTASGNNPEIGLAFGDGTKLVSLTFGFVNTTWHFEIDNWTNSTTFSSVAVSIPNPWGPTSAGLGYLPKLYMRIKDDGTNFLCSVSNDGFNFTQIGSVGRTAFMTTPSTVGIFAFGATGGTGGFTCDWFRRTDGGYIPGSGTVAGSITLATATIPGSVNLSTVGTLDWFAFNGTSFNPPRAQSGLVVHSKRFGGWIKNSFDWLNGGTGTVSFPTGAATGTTLTSSAADDMAPAMSASNPNAVLIRSGSGTPLNYGYCFTVPAFLSQHVLKFGMFVNSVKVTITCTMSDGSVAPQTISVDAVSSGTVVAKEIQITYNAGTPNAQMIVTVEVTANYGGSFQDVVFEYATLA